MNTIITETTDQGEIAIDVYQKLANDRILFIRNSITDSLAAYITGTLLLNDSEDPSSKITIFINSHGGDIRNALMICDIMRIVEAPIETVCIGSAIDEAAVILAAGTPGMRLATRNSVIAANQLTHDYIDHVNLTDAKKYLDLSLSDNKKMMEVLSKSTGKSVKQLMSDFDRRVFMTPNQALKYGFIDKVIAPNK